MMWMLWGTACTLVLVGGLTAIGVIAKHAIDPPTASGSSEDAASILAALDRMESRIGTLERILDADDPKWRGRT